MKPHQILDWLLSEGTVSRKILNMALGYKDRSMLDKMCREQPSDDNPSGTGIRNFLHEYKLTAFTFDDHNEHWKSQELAKWAARETDGFYTPHQRFEGTMPSDCCRIINDLLKSTNMITEQIRIAVFMDHGKSTFTKEERAGLYKELEGGMSALLTAREYIRTHKAEETNV